MYLCLEASFDPKIATVFIFAESLMFHVCQTHFKKNVDSFMKSWSHLALKGLI